MDKRPKLPRHVAIAECRKAGPIGERYGMFYVAVPAEFIGAKCRVRIEMMEKGKKK